MVQAIQSAVREGLSQKKACSLFGLNRRKFRRWQNPSLISPRIAWNALRPKERKRIIKTALHPDFWGKPLSHLYVYGHEKGLFYASISTLSRVLKAEDLNKPVPRRVHKKPYVAVPELLEQGFSLLCYDGTCFVTDTRQIVWALPVMLLPCRYLMHIGVAFHSVSTQNLMAAVDEAWLNIPEKIKSVLMAHSDRGSAMKSRRMKDHLTKRLNIPVHYGRPHTPDDEAWIEALIKTLKYHRDVPENFRQAADVLDWLKRFPDIYNNEPHSSLGYVTPRQALLGQKEVILEQRRKNLSQVRKERLDYYRKQKIGVGKGCFKK